MHREAVLHGVKRKDARKLPSRQVRLHRLGARRYDELVVAYHRLRALMLHGDGPAGSVDCARPMSAQNFDTRKLFSVREFPPVRRFTAQIIG